MQARKKFNQLAIQSSQIESSKQKVTDIMVEISPILI